MLSLEEYRKLPWNWDVSGAVFWAVAVNGTVYGAVTEAVSLNVYRAVDRAVSEAFYRGFQND